MAEKSPLKIALHGASGRMGTSIQASCASDPAFVVSLMPPTDGQSNASFSADDIVAGAVDVVIDFSHVSALAAIIQACLTARKPLLSGTTGLSDDEMRLLAEAAKEIPIFWAPNMSPGVNLCRHLAQQMSRSLGTGWDVEIVEAHHAQKTDSPSGTALHLGRAVAAGRGQDLQDVAEFQRHGLQSKRESGAIGFSSIRGGDVVGEHSVMFIGQGERLELRHTMSNRSGFANGALQAAKWLATQRPGLYGMDHMLGL